MGTRGSRLFQSETRLECGKELLSLDYVNECLNQTADQNVYIRHIVRKGKIYETPITVIIHPPADVKANISRELDLYFPSVLITLIYDYIPFGILQKGLQYMDGTAYPVFLTVQSDCEIEIRPFKKKWLLDCDWSW